MSAVLIAICYAVLLIWAAFMLADAVRAFRRRQHEKEGAE